MVAGRAARRNRRATNDLTKRAGRHAACLWYGINVRAVRRLPTLVSGVPVIDVRCHRPATALALLFVASVSLCSSAVAQGKPSPFAQSSPIQVSTEGQTDPTRITNGGPFTSTPFAVTNLGTTPVSGIRLSCRSSGAIATNCVISAPGWTGDLDAGETVPVSVIYYTTGVPQLSSVGVQAYVIETRQLSGNDKFFSVVAAPPAAAPGVVLRNQNDSVQTRSRCLTLGAGEAAAWQCGELLVSHSLPGYRTLNKERALTLVYSSAQAAPIPIAVAAVTEGGDSIARPDTIVAELQVNTGGGWTSMRTATYTPWGNPNGAILQETRQVALSWDAHTTPSGVYPFQVLVTNRYVSGQSLTRTIPGQFLVNNRATSPFYGIGWWPAGIEQLAMIDTARAIYGADGSVKLFQLVSAPSGQTRWVGAAEAFPDTLIQDNVTHLYSRTLRHGIKIIYDAAGRHIQTINRTGDTTFITYNGNSSISTIRVPPSGQAGTTYSFAYNPATALLQSITDPAGRVLTATMTAGRLTSLTDPDLVSTSFGYDLFSHMTSRTSRRGAATRYTFTNNRLTQFAIPFRTSPADSGITTIRPWEFVGLDGAPVDLPDSGYTRVDGPRTDSADVAKFWVDQWRAPTQVVGPNGDTLHVSRGSVATPALVTRVVRPDRTVDTLVYNARGNLKEQRTITDGLPGAVPMTITRWGYGAATAPDSPDTLVDSTAHLKTLYSYNQWGLTSLVTAPNGHQTRFDYVTNPASPLLGELQGIAELSAAVWDSTTRTKVTAAELRTGFAFNQLGNVVADTSPMKRVTRYTLDAMQRVQQLLDPANHRTEYFYDAIDRVDSLAEHVEDSDPSYQHPIVTHYNYNAADLLSIVDHRGVTRSYSYDLAGRQTAETDDYGGIAYRFYDGAGLVDSVKQRTGRVVKFTYDPGGRLRRKLWAAGDSGTVADSAKFAYDIMGRLVSAATARRSLTRTYLANGALASQTDAWARAREAFGYDSAGRRIWLRIGMPNDPARRDSIVYRYNTAGDLGTIWVRWRAQPAARADDSVRFVWDKLGRRDTLFYSNSAVVNYAYDQDGALRLLCSNHSVAGSPSNDVFRLKLSYDSMDADGLVHQSNASGVGFGVTGCPINNPGTFESVNYRYDNRHQMTQRQAGSTITTYQYDASHNMLQQATTLGDTYRDTMEVGHDRIGRHTNITGNYYYQYTYNPDASRRDEEYCTPSTGCQTTGSRLYFYDGLGRVALIYGEPPINANGYCGYDALGRLQTPCDPAPPNLTFDGDNVVRTGADSSAGSDWTFVQGPGTDDPLLGHYTGTQGTVAYFVTDGGGRQYAVGDALGFNQRGTSEFASHGGVYAGGTTSSSSFGAQRDSTGVAPTLSFFRNRVYDQATGRWTQEDPLGVAGGLNLYQFNGNDPANYTDPFGLCKDHGNCTQADVGASDIPARNTRGWFPTFIGATLSSLKAALERVHAEVGKLPKGPRGKFGSPQRGTRQKGYRLDPGHPNRAPDDPESGEHFNWWDWTKGHRGAGGRRGTVRIEPTEPSAPEAVPEVTPELPELPTIIIE